MNNFLITMSSAANDAAAAGTMGGLGILTMIIPLAAMVLIFWLFIIRPEKKRSREMQNMLNNLQVADEVVTTGGIIGLVVSVSKDWVLIETGSDRTKIRVVKSAIAQNKTPHEAPAAESAAVEKKSDKKSSKGKTEIK